MKYFLPTKMDTLVVLLVIIFDLLSKYWIINNMQLHDVLTVSSLLNFSFERNYGSAFGFFSSYKIWCRFLLIVINLCVLVFLLLDYNRNNSKVCKLSYALIFGGAIGNLLDRIYYGFVIDFIDLHIGLWHFVTFNIADLVICIGTLTIVITNCLI